MAQEEEKLRFAYLLLLNPDIELHEAHTTERLLTRLSQDESNAVCGPKLVKEDGTSQLWDHGDYYVPGSGMDKRFKPKLFPLSAFYQHTEATEVPWISGAAFAIKREDFLGQGGFDPNIFLYFEEVELCYRLSIDGKK